MSHLRVRVRAPGDDQLRSLGPALEQCVAQHGAGHEVRRVGELVRGAHVSGGENVGVGGAQILVDLHPLAGPGHPRLFKTQTFDIGLAPGGDQQLIDHLVTLPVRTRGHESDGPC